jgi:hypothetical protein
VVGFTGAVVAIAAALFAYDRFVVQPREAARIQEVKVDLAEGRTEAQQIAGALDASVDRTLERAREGFDELADDQDKTRLANDALARSAMYRVALTEAYMSNGAWPGSAQEAGLPPFDADAPGAVQSITVGADGVLTIALRAPFAGSRFVFTPRAGGDGMVQWSCRSEGDESLRRHARACAP